MSRIDFKLEATLCNEFTATTQGSFGDHQVSRWKPLQYQSGRASFAATKVADISSTANDNKRKALQALARLGWRFSKCPFARQGHHATSQAGISDIHYRHLQHIKIHLRDLTRQLTNLFNAILRVASSRAWRINARSVQKMCVFLVIN